MDKCKCDPQKENRCSRNYFIIQVEIHALLGLLYMRGLQSANFTATQVPAQFVTIVSVWRIRNV